MIDIHVGQKYYDRTTKAIHYVDAINDTLIAIHRETVGALMDKVQWYLLTDFKRLINEGILIKK